jgi:P22_AR N-terminal domain
MVGLNLEKDIAMTKELTVPFHDDTIQIIIGGDGGEYVPIKPISDRLELRWEQQRSRLKLSAKRWGTLLMGGTSAGGEQQMTCIPRVRLGGWLYSINPQKVKPEVRDTLIRYQQELDLVIDAYLTGSHTKETALLRRQNQSLKAYCLAFNPLWGKIAALQKAGVWCQFMRHHVKKSQMETGEMIHAMEVAGVIKVDDWTDAEFITPRAPAQANLFTAEDAA